MKLLWFVLVFFYHTMPLYGVFTNETFVVTSFPNVSESRYSFTSYQRTIYTDFLPNVVPGSKVLAYGTKGRNSFYVDNASDMTVLNTTFNWLHTFANFRIELSQKIMNNFPKSGALILALVLGNRQYLDDDYMDYIRFSGLAHMLALSGLHIVIAVGFLLWIFQNIGVQQRYWGVLTLPFSFFYLFLGGFGVSLQRAVLFHFLASIYQLIRIPSAGKNIFLLALMINLLVIPNNALTLSFWLSYLSVLGIVLFYNIMYDIIRRYVIDYIASMIAVSLSASLMVTPVIIWFFGYINIWSVIVNLLIVPLMPILLVLCFISVIFIIIDSTLYIFDTLVYIINDYILNIARFFSELPFGVIFLQSREIAVGMSILIILCFLLLSKKREDEFMER